MKNYRKRLLLLFSFFVITPIFSQVDWPFENGARGAMIGSIGEYRESRNRQGVVTNRRFHKGADLTNGTNYDIYASNSGIVTWYSHNNWSQGGSYIRVGNTFYWHCKPSTSILNAGMSQTRVEAGDYIGHMIQTGNIHVHLQENNTNFLENNLSPYTDNVRPELITTRFENGYKLYRNGITKTTTNYNNLEINNTKTFEGVEYNIIHSKIDIAVDVEDRRVTATGGNGGGRTAPAAYKYRVKNYEDTSQNNIYEYTLPFDRVPNNANAVFTFHPLSSHPGNPSLHIITSHPRNTPADRYLNTLIRNNVTENWDNTTVNDANYVYLAKFKDNRYTLEIDANDVDYDDNPNLSLANRLQIPIIIDNFLPFLNKVEVLSYPGPITNTFYEANWQYQAPLNLNLNTVVNENIPFNQSVLIRVQPSEKLKELKLTLGDIDYDLEEDNNGYWSVVVNNLSYPTQGYKALQFTGKDLNDNDLLLNPQNFPVKRPDGQWAGSPAQGTDIWHKIKYGSSNNVFGADFLNGPNCLGNKIKLERKSNNCLQVCFQDNSTPQGNITSWEWNFGDSQNSTSNLQNPSFTYDLPGVYDVSLTVTNTQNQTSTITKTITVDSCEDQINAQISSDVTSGNRPLVVNLNDLSTGDIYSRKWKILWNGSNYPNIYSYINGNESASQITLSLTTPGTYSISLELEDSFGNEYESNTISVYVTGNDNNPGLFVDFETSGNYYSGQPINFKALTSQGCSGKRYRWTFFDHDRERYSTYQEDVYTFPVAGTYRVELCVTDNCGNNICVSKYITISDYESSVIARFYTSIEQQFLTVKKGEPVYFYDISPTREINLYGSWYFDFGSSNAQPDLFYWYANRPNVISHTYDEVGIYRVRFYVGENTTHFGSVQEKVITVVDDYDYLEIPVLNESHKQFFPDKNFRSIQNRNFEGFLLAVNHRVNPAGRTVMDVEVYQNNDGHFIKKSTVLSHIYTNSPFNVRSVIGFKDKIAVAYSQEPSLVVEEQFKLEAYKIEIYEKTSPDWSSFRLKQTINVGDYDTNHNYVRAGAFNFSHNIIAVGIDKQTIPYRTGVPSYGIGESRRGVLVYEFNENNELFEEKATLRQSSYFSSTTSPNHESGDLGGRDIEIGNNREILSTGSFKLYDDSVVLGYSKTDIGWVNSIENFMLGPRVPNAPGNTVILGKIAGNFVFAKNLISGFTTNELIIFEKPASGWSFNNSFNYKIEIYDKNIEDIQVSDNQFYFGRFFPTSNGSGLITYSGAIKDFVNEEERLRWKTFRYFSKSNASWLNKVKEDLRIYPASIDLDDNYHDFSEDNGKLIQLYNKTNNAGSTLYTFDINNVYIPGAGVCNNDITIENETINSNIPGSEGRDIKISNSSYGSSSNIIYKAVNSIKITPNTVISSGASFSAKIVNCNNIN